ncbi:MAG: hypothetical protein COA38_13490, partial [Fluviicola sp.]
WLHPTSTGYIVEKEDKIGFLDLNHNEVLPTEFDQLSFCVIVHQGEGIQAVFSNRFLKVTQNKENGIFDLIQNKWIIPFTSKLIKNEFVTFCPNTDAVFYLGNSESNEVDVINSSGTQALTNIDRNSFRTQLTPIDSCGFESLQMTYLANDSKMRVTNLKTGKTSDEYPEIHAVGGYSIFFEKKKWGILDTNLNEVKRFSYPKSAKDEMGKWEGKELHRVARWRFLVLFSEYHSEQPDKILITRESLDQSKDNDYLGMSEIYGLLDAQTGKQIKQDYHWISKVNHGGESFYWAYKSKSHYSGETQKYAYIDVFDSDLTLLKRLGKETLLEPLSKRGETSIWTIEINEKYGVINPKGEIIIPVEYSELYSLKVQTKGNLAKDKKILIAKKDKQTTVFDTNGNVLFSKNYVAITTNQALIYAENEKGLTDLYNSEGELLIGGTRYFKGALRTDGFGKCIGMEDWPKIMPGYCTFITQSDKLYMFLNDSIQLLDEDFFEFKQKFCFFHEWALIDQKGRIVTMDPKGVSKMSDTYRRGHPNECSTFLEEYPIPKKESASKIVPKDYTIRPKRFVWKQHDTKKPKEWFLYNRDGQLLYPESFEYPLKERIFSGGVFKQNDKYGYFDAQYNKHLPAEYDYIYPYYPLTLKDGLWKIHDITAGKISNGYEQVSLNKINKLRFVFHKGKIGLLNDSLELEIKLTDSVEFIKKYDLVKLLKLHGHQNYKFSHQKDNIIYFTGPKDVYRKINNLHIIEEAFLSSTANDLLKFSPVDRFRTDLPYGLTNLVVHHKPNTLRKERRPNFFNQFFYSEMTLSRTESWSRSRWDDTYNDDRLKFRELFNYKIVGNNLVPIGLEGILKTDSNSVSKLHKLMIRELNKIQAFGDNCTDIEDKLEQLKNNFIINKNKITFHWGQMGGFKIELLFNELEDLFLYPTTML